MGPNGVRCNSYRRMMIAILHLKDNEKWNGDLRTCVLSIRPHLFLHHYAAGQVLHVLHAMNP